MKSHVDKDARWWSASCDFGLQSLRQVHILRNIVEFHHEAVDGSGYPKGLSGEQIPIETRIVCGDVFDALTAAPYKAAWKARRKQDRAFDQLRSMAGVKLDRDCVQALEKNRRWRRYRRASARRPSLNFHARNFANTAGRRLSFTLASIRWAAGLLALACATSGFSES